MRLPGVMRGVVEGVGVRGSVVTARLSRLRVRRGGGRRVTCELLARKVASGCVGGRARWDRPVQSSGAARAASGAVPAPRPRFAPIAHLAWWDGVSHVVTRPGSRARHLTPEIVP